MERCKPYPPRPKFIKLNFYSENLFYEWPRRDIIPLDTYIIEIGDERFVRSILDADYYART